MKKAAISQTTDAAIPERLWENVPVMREWN
jgi:hypothetical protein